MDRPKDPPYEYAKYIPPRVNSRIHSRTIFASSSECFSSMVCGGGAADATIESITSSGSLEGSFRIDSRSAGSIGACAGSGCSTSMWSMVEFCLELRFESRVQNDNRSVRAFTTVSVLLDVVDDGVDAVDEEGDGGPVSSLRLNSWSGRGETTFTSCSSANLTRGDLVLSASPLMATEASASSVCNSA